MLSTSGHGSLKFRQYTLLEGSLLQWFSRCIPLHLSRILFLSSHTTVILTLTQKGSHVARQLLKQGSTVRIVDISPSSAFNEPICHEFIPGNLCDEAVCKRAVMDIDITLHFAANMGGMGAIHETNEYRIYSDNNRMTMNILSASVKAGVKMFFFASSACVYPINLQGSSEDDVSLREDQVWLGTFPRPQGLYGLEKLVSEMLVEHSQPTLDIRIARFHNVYGPFGAWSNGREKAPAAMLRKAISLGYLYERSSSELEFEIWGDGTQRRSFLFIDDAVDAVLRLITCEYSQPLNIGSPSSISIQGLAEIALEVTSVESSKITFSYQTDCPVGVASRNSNNDLVERTLHWTPKTSLRDGMKKTGDWIRSEIDSAISACDEQECYHRLSRYSRSQVISLDSEDITYAILLPITSSGSSSPEVCLNNLALFAQSLLETTWRDTQLQGVSRYHCRVYLGIDHDDEFLLPSPSGRSRAEKVLLRYNISEVDVIICEHPHGHVCSIWRSCAKAAWEAKCDYWVLMGDDLVLKDEGWMRAIHDEFRKISDVNDVPHGFGCVSFTDTTFPGMPTFPVIHKIHMDIFDGTVVPSEFINQDGDPFLFQLYRRWGCSSMVHHRLTNGIGGPHSARYNKEYLNGWTFKPLSDAAAKVKQWLSERSVSSLEKLTLDVVIPCYRVNVPLLRHILDLKSSPTMTTMFIVIVDDPNSPNIAQLEREYAHRPDIRIRVNLTNMGASESRNRGMKESAADWIHFLDDDVVPDPNLLIEGEKLIRQNPTAAGFVGSTRFPPAKTIFTTAVHLAGVTHFWDIASNPSFSDDVPWGVTANLIARRLDDGIFYDPAYPKTGGGEDIDFCRKKRDHSISDLKGVGFIAGPEVKVVHPWWNGGNRSYLRFYMWAYGDGALIANFPSLTYRDRAPNGGELLCGCLMMTFYSYAFISSSVGAVFAKAFVSAILANMVFDTNQHLIRHPERFQGLNTELQGLRWTLAVLESTFIRMATEIGRIHGLLARGEWRVIGTRFDWFAGRLPAAISEERMNNLQRLVLTIMIFYLSQFL